MKVRIQKMADPTPWCVDVPEFGATPRYYYGTWPEAMEAALSLWEKLNCQIAT